MTEKDLAVRNQGAVVQQEKDIQPFSTPLVVSPAQIAQTTQSLATLRKMIQDVLLQDVDYGTVPGVPEEFLWEPGANQIIAAFNCHVGSARVLSQTTTDDLIAAVLEIPLISFQTNQEVACCVGAASTTEVKHKYRWIKKYELADWGYVTEEQIRSLKTKPIPNTRDFKYQIRNPEPGDLLNTIWKIAFKRGMVGAAQKLPGVSSALREQFGKSSQSKKTTEKKSDTDWNFFWSEMNKMGLAQDEVHRYLGVKSVKEWVTSGKTLDGAISAIHEKMAAKKAKDEELPDLTPPPGQTPGQTPKKASKLRPVQEWEKVTKDQISNYQALEQKLGELVGMAPREIYKELGVSGRSDMVDPPWESFLAIKNVYYPKDAPVE